MLTLNQDVEIFKNFVLKHKGINTFYFGDEWEADSSVNIVYPFMNVILQGSKNEKGLVSRTYLVIVSDLVNKDESNETQVLSDTEQLCFDLPYYLRGVSNSGLLGAFQYNANISLTDFTERNDDMVSGHYFDLTISSYIGNNACNLPINAGNILDHDYIYVGGIYTPITSTMNITTETFTYAGSPITLANTPIDILTVFADASVQFLTADYTQAGAVITPTSPIVENGTIIRITYTY